MPDDREIVVGTSMQLRGCEFIPEEEKKTLCVGEKVHP